MYSGQDDFVELHNIIQDLCGLREIRVTGITTISQEALVAMGLDLDSAGWQAAALTYRFAGKTEHSHYQKFLPRLACLAGYKERSRISNTPQNIFFNLYHLSEFERHISVTATTETRLVVQPRPGNPHIIVSA